MKFSIITVCWNSEDTIKSSLESVNEQTFEDIEHIIIDGGSNDSTLEIVKKFGRRVRRIISEPDGGIYHAMNKGIQVSSGEFIGFLNSDDFFADSAVIERYAAAAKNEDSNILYSDVTFIDRLDKTKIRRNFY